MNSALPATRLQWDIFCRVIDNFGDIGVCWRLAVNLAQLGQSVRLWTDDASALDWMAPHGASGVQLMPWSTPLNLSGITPGDVLVEAFGCEIDPEFIALYAYQIKAIGQNCIWINLEYLSAEPYAQRCHGLPSPVMSGPGQGLTKRFYYPGFVANSGGLLREADLLERQARFDRRAWLAQFGIDWPASPPQRQVSLFCYEPVGLATLLNALADDAIPTRLLVTAGRAAAAVRHIVTSNLTLQPNWNKRNQLSFLYLPALTQLQFDELLWACDLNFVRGEDSLVRALWAGKPLVWQAYPQDDGAHHAKLDAFLAWLQAPPDLRQFHRLWNDVASANAPTPASAITAICLPQKLSAWQHTMAQARQNLLAQHDLANGLIEFVAKNP